MKASVVIPAWGDTPYLDETRACLAAQSMSDFEMIVCQPPPGESNAGAARNDGLAKVKGEWVFFVDADDLPEPDFLSCAIDAGERTGADVVVFRADEVDARLGCRVPMPYLQRLVPWADGTAHRLDELGAARFTTLGLAPWNKAVRREFLVRNGIRFQSIKRSNDVAFTVELLGKASTFTAVDRSLIGYRVNNAVSLQATNAETPTDFYDALLEAKNRLDGSHADAFRALAKETIGYHLHSVRTLEAYRTLCKFLSGRSIDDFGVPVSVATFKGLNPPCFKIGRAFETLYDRGLTFCIKRVLGRMAGQ